MEIVHKGSHDQLNILKKNINTLADQYKDDWNKLIKCDIPDEYAKVRQDVIPNGIISQYTCNQLSESTVATSNLPKFYDQCQHLSQLV